jgi:hypothetical protein
MWSRFYSQVRAAFPGQLIVGPSMSGKPGSGNGWWTSYLAYVHAHNAAPDIWSWHDEPGDPAAEVGPADSTLAAAGLSRTRPYQINEYATPDMQTPGGGAWFISRLERAGADGLRGNWGSGPGLHDDEAGLLTDLGGGQYQALGEWYMYQYYGSQSGNIVDFIPGGGFDGLATKDNTAGNAKILLGSNGDTGNVTVGLAGLNTTSVVRNGQVRAVVQLVPYNNGNSVSGPVTITDTTLSVVNNTASVVVPYADARDGYTVTLLPPSSGGGTTGELHAVGSGKCLDVNNFTTTPGTQVQIYDCNGGSNQIWTDSSGRLTVYSGSTLRCLDANNQGTTAGTKVIIWPCNGQVNQQWVLNSNGTITGVQSGLCLDVTGAGTANGTPVELWTCNGHSNQQWKLG